MAKNKIVTEEEIQPTSGKDLVAGLTASAAPLPESVPSQDVDSTVEAPSQTPTTEAPQATPAEQVSETSPASPDTAARYLDRIKGLGFSDVKDEDDAMNRLLESYEKQRQEYEQINRAYQQSLPFAQYGQQYLQQMQTPAYQEFMKQKQAPQQAQQPEQDPRRWWNPPTYDPVAVEKYREVVVDQQSGQPVVQWKWNTPAEVRTSVDSWNSYREQWAEALVNNPQAALQPFKREVIADVYEMVRDMYGNIDQERQVQDLAEQILENNKEWLYSKDPRTNEIDRDPLTGKAKFSELGEYAAALVEHAEKIGVRDFSEQWDYAVKGIRSLLAERTTMQQQTQSPSVQSVQSQAMPSTEEVAAQKKQQLLARSVQGNGANSIPSRGGSEPPSDSDERRTRSQNKNISAGKKILAELKKSGSLVG